jgi:hypothetical protein
MRAGKLKHRIELISPTGVKTLAWADIEAPANRSVNTDGLRTGIKIILRLRLRLRQRDDIAQNWLVRHRDSAGWYLVEYVDEVSKRDEILLMTEALAGQHGTYQPETGDSYPIWVYETRNTPYMGMDGQLLDYRHKLEMLSVQFRRPFQRGDQIQTGTNTYNLRGIAEGGDDGVIVQFMA